MVKIRIGSGPEGGQMPIVNNRALRQLEVEDTREAGRTAALTATQTQWKASKVLDKDKGLEMAVIHDRHDNEHISVTRMQNTRDLFIHTAAPLDHAKKVGIILEMTQKHPGRRIIWVQ